MCVVCRDKPKCQESRPNKKGMHVQKSFEQTACAPVLSLHDGMVTVMSSEASGHEHHQRALLKHFPARDGALGQSWEAGSKRLKVG